MTARVEDGKTQERKASDTTGERLRLSGLVTTVAVGLLLLSCTVRWYGRWAAREPSARTGPVEERRTERSRSGACERSVVPVVTTALRRGDVTSSAPPVRPAARTTGPTFVEVDVDRPICQL